MKETCKCGAVFKISDDCITSSLRQSEFHRQHAVCLMKECLIKDDQDNVNKHFIPLIPTQYEQKLEQLLLESNDMLRSCISVVNRCGENTNWAALNERLRVTLKEQHETTNKIRANTVAEDRYGDYYNEP